MTDSAPAARFGRAGEARTAARIYSVPAGTSVYAIGDIHGRADLLTKIHKIIRADAGRQADGRRKIVVYLGDYVDRGAKSRQVIEMLLRSPLEGFDSIYLKGNHEDYMLGFLEGGGDGLGWLFNGGEATLASYGVAAPGSVSPNGGALDELRVALNAALPEDHRAFLASLELHHREGGYLFVHAGIRPEVALAEQSADDLMWIRDEFLSCDADHDCRVVHGHTITWSPEVLPNRIGIDTGAYVSGALTCLVIEGAETRFLTARG
jgi:diadenosine tetraphosphatase ApaH/serine/threonine PP2A family protein phosphatase